MVSPQKNSIRRVFPPLQPPIITSIHCNCRRLFITLIIHPPTSQNTPIPHDTLRSRGPHCSFALHWDVSRPILHCSVKKILTFANFQFRLPQGYRRLQPQTPRYERPIQRSHKILLHSRFMVGLWTVYHTSSSFQVCLNNVPYSGLMLIPG